MSLLWLFLIVPLCTTFGYGIAIISQRNSQASMCEDCRYLCKNCPHNKKEV